ncbi:potassium channel subfamily K member 18-like [Glandiceps talaboti]
MATDKNKSIAKVRDVACRFNVFRKSIRNTTILFVVVIAYVMLGGLLFHYLEGPGNRHSSPTANNSNTAMLEMMAVIENLWNKTSYLDKEDWMKFTFSQVDTLKQMKLELDMRTRWNYLSACFFCLTVVSTIGYGTITPVTVTGRFVCIFYAIIGIPLFVVFLAKLGKLISVPLKYTHRRINERYKCCKTFIVQRTDDITSVVHMNTRNSVSRARDSNENSDENVSSRKVTHMRDSSNPEELGTLIAEEKTPDTEVVDETFGNAEDEPSKDTILEGNTPMHDDDGGGGGGGGGEQCEDSDHGWGNQTAQRPNSVQDHDREFSPSERQVYDEVKQDYENAPVTFIVVVLLLYIATGSAMLMFLEKRWSYIDAIYFSIITFTTIGFGDITPADQHGKLTDEEIVARQTFVSCYIVFGLVVMAIALNLARDQLKSKVRTFVKEQNEATGRCRQCLPKCACTQKTDV